MLSSFSLLPCGKTTGIVVAVGVLSIFLTGGIIVGTVVISCAVGVRALVGLWRCSLLCFAFGLIRKLRKKGQYVFVTIAICSLSSFIKLVTIGPVSVTSRVLTVLAGW
eukprot:c9712_g1_i1.p1 GENE.c9712_g1_i1~~c9712_g1_i1.p1  ORF type:complete len:108 (+),score=5.52 c9712_g1_i1:162-485(+)